MYSFNELWIDEEEFNEKTARFLEDRIKDSGLTKQEIADRMGTSIRQLQRLLSVEKKQDGSFRYHRTNWMDIFLLMGILRFSAEDFRAYISA